MNIHEYQAKAVLREFGVPVPRGHAAFTVEEAVKAASELGAPVVVVKAQIHAGGRGKAGGVKVVKSKEEVRKEAERLLGSHLVTHQTGPHGKQVNRLYIEEGSAIDREFYLGPGRPRELAHRLRGVDRGRHGHRGGRAHPSRARSSRFPSIPRPGSCRITAACVRRRWDSRRPRQGRREVWLRTLYTAFIAKDMSLLEINPLVVTKGGELLCLDAKIGFDDNALYRHPDIVALRDLTEEDEKEIEASKYDLNYVALDGTIGCMVNGAGSPWRPWTSSSSTARRRRTSSTSAAAPARRRWRPPSRSSLADPKVKGILVNIFGGIMKCDVIAEGVVAAVKEVGLRVPLVVRLEGTNVELGKEIIRKSKPRRHRRRRPRRRRAEDRQGGEEGH